MTCFVRCQIISNERLAKSLMEGSVTIYIEHMHAYIDSKERNVMIIV